MNLRDTWIGNRALGGGDWLLVALLAAGCAPGWGNVSGTVTYQGKQLTTGTIIFYDAANGAPSAEIKPDGTYTVSHVRAGTAKIAIVMPMDIPFMGFGGPAPAKTPEPGKVPTLPAKYADREQSGLTCEVKAGNNTHDVKLD
jgi:hypothetical protein